METDQPARPTPRLLEPVRLLVVAARFLTRLPFPEVHIGPHDLRRATAAFPLVGALVAGTGIAAAAVARPLWGTTVAVLLAVAVEIGVTGAFHEDGLADVADGLWGGWTPEDRLRIMRDSRLGTYGTVALLGVLSLRVALLAGLDATAFWRATLAGHVVGRGAIIAMIRLLPPADDGGSGAAVSEPVRPLGVAVAATTVLGALTLVTLWPDTSTDAVLLLTAVLVGAVLVVAALRRLYRRRLGGITGDALGATAQLVQLSTIAALAAVWGPST